jgi:hypothetical protein
VPATRQHALSRALIRTIVACLALLLTSTAGAQSFSDHLAPGLTRPDYQTIVSLLNLTKDQRSAADQLYEGYATEHAREAAAYKGAFDKLRKATHYHEDTGQWDVEPGAQKAVDEATERYNNFRPKAKAQAISDIKALLTEEQAAQTWPKVERLVRRMLMRNVLLMSPVEWARADISRCVTDLKLPPDLLAKVQALLDDYELSVDKPLQRVEHVKGWDEDARRTWREAAREIGSLNKRYLRMVAQELPPQDAAKLTAAAKSLAYWFLYINDGRFIRERLAEAKKLPSFTDEQQKRADALLAEIDKAVAQFRKEATPDYDEADAKVEGLSQKEWDEAMTREDNPFVKLQEKWSTKFDEVWMAWIDRMTSILTDQQRRELWPPSGDPLASLRPQTAQP